MINLTVSTIFSELKWFIHNGLQRTSLIYQSHKQEISISQHRWNRVQWSLLTKTELKKREYKKLLEHLPGLLSYVETFKKTSITLDKRRRKLMDIVTLLNIFNCYSSIFANVFKQRKTKNLFPGCM